MAQDPETIESESEPAADVRDEIARLRAGIERLGRREQQQADLRGIGTRLAEVVGPMRAKLVGALLPLSQAGFAEVRSAVDAEIAFAELCLRIVREMRSPFLIGFRNNAEVVREAVTLLADAFETCAVAGIVVPQGFWHTAHALYACARDDGFDEALPPYKRLLALATIQPESFTSAELVEVFALVRALSDLGELVAGVGEPPGQGWFWIDLAQDAAPVAVVRRDPPPVDDLAYFSAAPLARAAGERLAKRSATTGDPTADPQLADGSGEGLLRRLRERWAMPPRRAQPRRRNEYPVQVCTGLDEIWQRLVRGEARSSPPLEWMVQNESPGGFSIMRVAGSASGLSAGMALGLRREGFANWAICVVRWIRSEQPDQVELGLQLVAQTAIPVRVAFRSGISAKAPVRALVLPPLAAVRRHQAVLAPAGTYAARRFVLIQEGERLYVAQGRLLSLDMQTEAVELFQFEVDPYPI